MEKRRRGRESREGKVWPSGSQRLSNGIRSSLAIRPIEDRSRPHLGESRAPPLPPGEERAGGCTGAFVHDGEQSAVVRGCVGREFGSHPISGHSHPLRVPASASSRLRPVTPTSVARPRHRSSPLAERRSHSTVSSVAQHLPHTVLLTSPTCLLLDIRRRCLLPFVRPLHAPSSPSTAMKMAHIVPRFLNPSTLQRLRTADHVYSTPLTSLSCY